LFDKYNKKPPKTWDELIDTAEHIITQEEKEGNDGLIGYMGNFESNFFKKKYYINNIFNY